MRKPVIAITVYRRYYELTQNLKLIHQFKSEFAVTPDIVVVWAQPEVPRLWFFQELLASGHITSLLTRPHLVGESSNNTTYPESYNLSLALRWVSFSYKDDAYLLGQAADVEPKPGAYRTIDKRMQEGCQAFLIHWPNGVCRSDIWHTNFFAVGMDENYWPPVAEVTDADTLERQWGLSLSARRLPYIEKSHNASNRFFSHRHLSEGHEPWPCKHQADSGSANLFIVGHKSIWRRLQGVFSTKKGK
jgi:hypothetical protein